MIIIFILDLILCNVLNIPLNLIISFIPFVNQNNIASYLAITIFISTYYWKNPLLYILIIIILFLINNLFFRKQKSIKIIMVNYLIYYLLIGLIYNSLNIVRFIIIYFITFILVSIIYHILPKQNINLVW